MSYFPPAARFFVVLTLACGALTLPTVAVAADHPRPVAQTADHPRHETRRQSRARARAEAALAARVRAHSLAVARMKASLRANKSVPKRASIVFDKNWKNPYNSRMYFRVWAKTGLKKGPKKWVPVEQASWRAGSGIGGAAGKDECHRGAGWSPNGTYSFVQQNRRKARLINGRVFELESKACRNGTLRQLMFIHSEQNWDNTQCRNKKGDDGCRWEVPVVNDYRSWGCIKMAPGDLKQLTQRFHRYFKSDVRYATDVVKVRVKD